MTDENQDILRRFYDGVMRPGELVATMCNKADLFPKKIIKRAGEVRSLPKRAGEFPSISIQDGGRVFDLYDFMVTNRVAGLLIMKDGKVAFEAYELGIQPDTQWGSCSLAKSFSSALVGAAVLDGHIQSLDDPLSRYVKIGGAYEDVTVRQLLRMNSGVTWSEAYTDPDSDRRQLLAKQLEYRAGAIVEHMGTVGRVGPPGSAWNYNTGESYLVGALMEAATGISLADYLTSKIWSRLGMEHDATWWLESPGGMVVSGSGMTATLRDYARFGQFVLDDGIIDGERVVPEGWFAESGAPYFIDGQEIPYGYMWWVPELQDPVLKGSYQAEGIYGQYIHINPRERLAVVLLSARSKPGFRARLEINDDAFFAAVAKALQ